MNILRKRCVVIIGAGALVLIATFALWLAWPDLIEPAVSQTTFTSTPQLIERGRYLARAGNCVACHTVQGKTPFAGGRPIPTPFGDVFSTNLTPDFETGLGAWTTQDFWRALHHGKSRDGRMLYPAFPYPNYTRVNREDSDAIFAYLKSLAPISNPRMEPSLRFPYNMQLALRVWRMLYFRAGEFVAEPKQTAEWNRGAYLVEGLGHCNACHTARTWLGGSKTVADYSGSPLPMLGWDALPLTTGTPMSDAEAVEMTELLRAGTSRRGVTSGPMAEVVFHSLQYLNVADVSAMVTYIRSLPHHVMQPAPAIRVSAKQQLEQMKSGGAVYRKHCADCHGDNGEGKPYVYPALSGNRLVTAPSATNAMRAVMYGGYAPSTAANPQPYGMPPFSHQLSAEEIAAVLTYVRNSWDNQARAISPVEVQRH